MTRQIALFAAPLTTRGVADIVKSAGVAGLPSATRLADDAHYQEVVCRSALNRTRGMPFRFTLNPYRGCTHACQYCFARRYQTQLELGAGDHFSSYIFVKRNVADVLARELRRASWLALVNCGITMAAKMPRMITTIRISTSVKPLLRVRRIAVMTISPL